jgi:hypothetical protein
MPKTISDAIAGGPWRKADKFLLFILGCMVLLGLMGVHAAFRVWADGPQLRGKADIVQRLCLTDLCLSTETAYTRQPSQADRHAPFQTHPLALEHFPTGGIITPRK